MIRVAAVLLTWALLGGGGGEELELRPWSAEQTFREELEARRASAREPAELLELARLCERRGFFGVQLELLNEVRATDPSGSDEARAPALGAPDLSLAAIEGAALRTLLRERDKPTRLANKTTYFDLYTDLDADSQGFYAELLNDYYRSLRARFPAWPGGATDVVLYRNRSDYLLDLQRATGASHENVLGFYIPGRKLLCFYDERHDRDDVAVTARHECTHLALDLAYDGAPIPDWLNEGLACFLATDRDRELGVLTAGWVVLTVDAVQQGRRPYLTELMATDSARFTGAHYPFAWAWVHYLSTSSDLSQRRMRRFLKDLRTELDPGMDEDTCRAQVASTLREVFGDAIELQSGWDEYWARDFALVDEQQALDFGWAALELAQGAEETGTRERLLEWSQRAFAAAGESARLGQAACLVERLRTEATEVEALELGLRAVRDALSAVPGEDDGRVGAVALGALRAAKHALGLEGEPPPFDLRAALVGDELVALHDDLLQLAAGSLRAALDRDPAHRRAAHDWVVLAVEVAPAALESVLPTLRLLVQIDPDDRNLADLAVVHASLGDPAWARVLFGAAQERSVRRETLGSERLADGAPSSPLAPGACSLCAGESAWPCERCDSEGHLRRPCSSCGGEGVRDCPFCVDGAWPCPGCRGEKEIRWESGDSDPCKVCSRRGTFRCAFCAASGEIGCASCGKRGSRMDVCTACLGVGRFPCPGCRAEACVVCEGHSTRSCSRCDGDGRLEGVCAQCAGTDKRFCRHCFAGRDPCPTCSGAGTLHYAVARNSGKTKAKKCEACSGKGFERCRECRDGLVACEEPAPVEDCAECDEGRVRCERCR